MPACLRLPEPAKYAPLLLVCWALFLSGCAVRAYIPNEVDSALFLERKITQEEGPVRVTVAVPDAGETETLFGLPLYDQGVQPVWLEIENNGAKLVRLSVWSLDPDYFSPLEVAWMNRGGFDKAGKAAMERWFYENAMERRIPPRETRSGFTFTHLQPGTKGFNVDVIAPDLRSFNFTFFVPIPGFTADYMEVDFQGLYPPDEIVDLDLDLDLDSLRQAVAEMPCCSTDESGTKEGAPFNIVIVGTGLAVRRALMRADWQETAVDSPETAVARMHRYRGRRPDGTFVKSRPDGSERKELRLWLAPIRADDEQVWLGQVSYDLSAKSKERVYIIDPDIDLARLYLVQNFWYSQSLAQHSYAKGAKAATVDAPRETFSGAAYFTDGLRAVLWLSEQPVGLDETKILAWEFPGDWKN